MTQLLTFKMDMLVSYSLLLYFFSPDFSVSMYYVTIMLHFQLTWIAKATVEFGAALL